MITRVRGTQDILDTSLRNFITQTIQKHLSKYNFHQIETPILEPTNLFVRSLGSYTDVVSKEMYVFETKSGESICLRPEATASTMRAFLENPVRRTPWKVFSIGPMFRHERPQKGRWRQFTQINIEIIGSAAIEQDAQLLYLLDRLFRDVFKLDSFAMKINFLGCLDDRNRYREILAKFLNNHKDELCKTCLVRKENNILRIFDCKNDHCKTLYRKAPQLTDHLCSTCNNEWETLQTSLDITSVNRIHDPHLVRGLDYYNKTVFEFSSPLLGAQDAFCGGGRWNLSKELGSKQDYPSLGAAIGMGRLLLLLESQEEKLSLAQPPALHVIVPMSDAQKNIALLLSHKLLHAGMATDIILDSASIGNMMKKANKLGAKYVLILGEEEQTNGTVMIKNMMSGKQETVKQNEVIEHLK